MRKYILFFSFLLSAMLFSSCDEGRIYEKEIVVTQEGRVMKMTGTVSGIASWASGYDIVVAGFENDGEYTVVSKSVPVSADGTNLTMVMAGIPENVTSLKLCAVNRLRKDIADFYTLSQEEISATTDTIMMNVGTVDVSMFNAIQTHIFNESCVACHGNTGAGARGLFLTNGRSYSNLVGVPSAINGDYLRVKPGDAENSYLHLVLNEEGYDAHGHLDILDAKKSTILLSLIDDWINNGAQE